MFIHIPVHLFTPCLPSHEVESRENITGGATGRFLQSWLQIHALQMSLPLRWYRYVADNCPEHDYLLSRCTPDCSMSRPRLIRARTGLDTSQERVCRPSLIRAWSALDIPQERVTRPKLVRARSGLDIPEQATRPKLIRALSGLDTSHERTALLQPVDEASTVGAEDGESSHESEDSIELDITIGHTVLFALATGFTTANLYYCQPILDVIATDFNVSPAQIADLAALAQAGNAVGLLFILPVADLLPKRQFLLVLMAVLIISW